MTNVTKADTIPRLLQQSYIRYGDKRVAMRAKKLGIWQEYTWKDYWEKVKYVSLGLVSLGLKRGDKVAILGENKPEWFWAEVATQAAGATTVGVHTECMANEVKYFVTHSDSKFVFAHDQEQVDKMLQIKDDLPLVKRVIYWDDRGLWSYDDPILMSFDQLIEIGREYEKLNPGLFERNVEKGSGEEIAVISYTSGTTGLPKGAMLCHKNLVSTINAFYDVDHWDKDFQYVSFLSPGWVAEQALGVVGSLLSAMEVNFPEKTDTVQANIREIGAQVLFWGPRNWESVTRLVQAKITDTTFMNRFLYNLLIPVGYKMADIRQRKEKPSLFWRFMFLLSHWVLFRDLRDKIGLSKVKVAYTAAAPISPDILRYFQAIGVNIKQLYAGTEQSLVTLHRDDDIIWETSGQNMPRMEVRVSDDGEISVRGDNLFVGYYKDEKTTQEKLRAGWYYTGDFGHIDDNGHLIVMDRMSDLRELASGHKFSPQYAVIRLRFSPYIKDVLVVGGEKEAYVTALVNMDLDNVGRWAEARRIAYTTFTDLSQKPEIIDLIRKDFERLNRYVPEWARIKKFANLHREFDADEAELTRTRKLRRTFVEERYSDLISALYSDASDLQVEAPITYRDGRKGVISTSIKINSIV